VNRGNCYEEIPLTIEDVLHPQEEDRATIADLHRQLVVYLTQAMASRVKSIPQAMVVSDLRIDWGDPGPEPHGPDVAVIFNVREYKNWSTFYVADEGTRPTLLIEVTSPSTRFLDFGIKIEEYEQGQAIEDYDELESDRDAVKRRADRAESETMQARSLAEQAQRRADAEAEAREKAEARIRELEAELRRRDEQK